MYGCLCDSVLGKGVDPGNQFIPGAIQLLQGIYENSGQAKEKNIQIKNVAQYLKYIEGFNSPQIIPVHRQRNKKQPTT